MMVELIVTSGALVGDLIQRYRGKTRTRPTFEKIMPGDPRGHYGEYLLQLEEADAWTVMRRYSSKITEPDGPASIDEA